MPAQPLLGAPLVESMKASLLPEIGSLKARGVSPAVTALTIAGDPASKYYARGQKKAFEAMGLAFASREILPATTQEELLGWIDALNRDAAVTAVTIHMPLPAHLDPVRTLLRLDPDKDLEGTHPANVGMLTLGFHEPSSCSARAAVELLRSVRPSIRGLEVTILGKGGVAGKPLLLMLLEQRKDAATPRVVGTATKDILAHTRASDVIFCAAGKPGLLRGDMVRPGAIVIDIGINEVPVTGPDGKPAVDAKGRPQTRVVGDAVYDEVAQVASYVTPVPGGVGPVAQMILVRNWAACAKRQLARRG
jgi:methylenetetrahydrofolate dehydrogenase (NADP+) / methenyltetrahydrofolate cyclohydrolase